MRFGTVVANIEYLEQPVELRAALRMVEPGGNLHVVRTVPRGREPAAESLRAEFDELRARVGLLVPDAGALGTLGIHVRLGDRVEETARLATEAQADLVALAALRADAHKVAANVLSWTACSVLILQPSRELAEVDALAPMFPLCPDCAVTRKQDSAQWFCPTHREADRRLYGRLPADAE